MQVISTARSYTSAELIALILAGWLMVGWIVAIALTAFTRWSK
jgi:hypothetical protein